MEGDARLNEEIVGALPGYSVTGMLGRGAMGEVLGGRHERLDRPVAIKRLPPGFAGDPDVRERFGQEARVLASLNHPHIVPVYDYVERDGLCLLVMEALPGGTVWDRFTDTGLTMPTACAVAMATCAGLEYAHAKRVLHRDVKPDNLMFDAEGGLKVTDFGIATVFGGEDTLATADGMIVGTPAYMAPEQAEGRSVGPAADVYAAATMLYELVSGRLPFDAGEEPRALLQARIEQDPIPLDQVAPSVPAGLVEVTMRGLARAPEDRYPTAEAFGVAVGEAATAAWGPGWLASSDVRLMAAGSIAAAAEAASAPSVAPASVAVVASEDEQGAGEATVPGTATIGPDGAPDLAAGATIVPGTTSVGPEGTDQGAAGATIVPGAVPAEPVQPPDRGEGETIAPGAVPTAGATSAPPTIVPGPVPEGRVVGQAAAHSAGPDLSELGPEELVPVQDVLTPPPAPWAALALAAALLVATILVAGGLLGGPDREVEVEPGFLRVAGVDIGRDQPVPVDLASPVRIRMDEVPPGAEGATSAQLAMSGLGLPLGTSNDKPFLPGEGFVVTEVSATTLRLISSGTVTGELRLLDDAGAEVFSTQFALEPDQPPLLSGLGVLSLLILLGGVAYAWGLSRPLRSGRRRFSPLLGVAGGVIGVGLALTLWQAGGEEPVPATLVGSAALGALGGLVGGWALGRLGRARRIRRSLRSVVVAR